MGATTTFRGRGAADNPANRFEPLILERDPDLDPASEPAPATRFYRDASCSLITYNDSPDIGYAASLNPYRGCEHGCIYCYARPTHEYLGFSAGLDFETRIMVKTDAPELLRRELASRRWKPQALAMCGVTDCYQPVERRLELTRRCLAVLAEFLNPVGVVTKNHLVTRDADVLVELARHHAAAVTISLTTLDGNLATQLEPRTSQPTMRLDAVARLRAAGVPVGVLVAPVIPAINDHEIPAVLKAAAEAGSQFAGYTILRLPHGLKDLFADWLARHFPDRREKVLGRIREMRGGKLNDSSFGMRMSGEGIWAEQIAALFDTSRRKAGIAEGWPELSTMAFRPPASAGSPGQQEFKW